MTRPDPSSATASPNFFRRLLTEPTVHFLFIAAALFAFYSLTESSRGKILEIDQNAIDARVFMRELETGEALAATQRDAIIQSYIEEQILVQEALALGLDDDARIHDLLAQKMRHVLSGDVIQPTDSELQSFYQQNQALYERPAALSVDELVFNSREELPDNIRSALQEGADAEALLALQEGNSAPLNNVTRLDLANIFSPTFADRVFAADNNAWTGPHLSNRGQHWLRITERLPASIPPLEAIRDRVRLEWIAIEEERRLESEIQQLKAQYSIIVGSGTADE